MRRKCPFGLPSGPGKTNIVALPFFRLFSDSIRESGTGTDRSCLSFGRKPHSGFDFTAITLPLESTFLQEQNMTSCSLNPVPRKNSKSIRSSVLEAANSAASSSESYRSEEHTSELQSL